MVLGVFPLEACVRQWAPGQGGQEAPEPGIVNSPGVRACEDTSNLRRKESRVGVRVTLDAAFPSESWLRWKMTLRG